MSPLTEAAHLARFCLILILIESVLSVYVRKRASPLSEISLEHYRDLGKRTKKVLTAIRNVLADIRILLNFSRHSFFRSRRAHMNRT